MEPAQFTAFFIVAVLLYGSPGPATLSLAASGSAVGLLRSLPFLCGILLGLLANFLVAMLGLTVLFEQAPFAVTVFRYLSLIYILYLAARMLRSMPTVAGQGDALKFSEGVLVNLLNPKAYIAALAVLSQFGGIAPGRTWILVITVMTIGLFVDFAWCFSGAILGRSVTTHRGTKVIRFTLVSLLVSSVVFATFWN